MNYRNQSANTNTGSCGITSRRPVYPDCGCNSTTPVNKNCGCVSPAQTHCGCDKPITPVCPTPAPCGCISGEGPIIDCGVLPPCLPEVYCNNPAALDQLNGMPLAMAYVPWQTFRNLYCVMEGFHKGTIFQDLDLNFLGRRYN